MTKNIVTKDWTGILSAESGILYSDVTKIPDNTPPTIPSSLSVTQSFSSALTVSWTASTDAHGIAYYEVYMHTSSGNIGSKTLIGTTTSTSYQAVGLIESTTYYFQVIAVDNSREANRSGESVEISGSTAAAPVGSGQFPLSAGHFIDAKFSMHVTHPRPDSETNTWEYHRNSYHDGTVGLAWRTAIKVQGGARPLRYVKISGPSWMTIGQDYGDTDYGILKGTPTAQDLTGTPVTIRIIDQQRNSVDITWTHYVTSSKWLFIDSAAADNSGAGGRTTPKKNTRGWYLDDPDDGTYAGKLVYYRGGTHSFYFDPNASSPGAGEFSADANNNALKPLVHVGYPGETAIFDMSSAQFNLSKGSSGFYLGNATIQNSYRKRHQYFVFGYGDARPQFNGGCRQSYFEMNFKNHYPSNQVQFPSIRNSTYRWTAQGTNTGEYYLELAAGGNPSITWILSSVRFNGTRLTKVTTSAALTAGQWAFRDPGTGFSTIVVRLTGDVDPDTLAVDQLTGDVGQSYGNNTGSLWYENPDPKTGSTDVSEARLAYRRSYFMVSHCTTDNYRLYENGQQLGTDGNGVPLLMAACVDYCVVEFNTLRNHDGRHWICKDKSNPRWWTVAHNDCWDPNLVSSSPPYLEFPINSSYQRGVTNAYFGYFELCWNKFASPRPLNDSLHRWDLGPTTNRTQVRELHVYRNTFYSPLGSTAIFDSEENLSSVTYPGAGPKTYQNNLFITSDTDGFRLPSGGTAPTTDVSGNVRISLTTAGTDIDLNTGAMLAGNATHTSYYGTVGYEVA